MTVSSPSDFDRPAGGDTRHGFILNAFTLWTNIACLIFVVLRLITRRKITKSRLWWDDYFIILAMVGFESRSRRSALCLMSLTVDSQIATAIGGSLDACEVHFGFGTHEYYLNEHQVRYFTAYAYGECEFSKARRIKNGLHFPSYGRVVLMFFAPTGIQTFLVCLTSPHAVDLIHLTLNDRFLDTHVHQSFHLLFPTTHPRWVQ